MAGRTRRRTDALLATLLMALVMAFSVVLGIGSAGAAGIDSAKGLVNAFVANNADPESQSVLGGDADDEEFDLLDVGDGLVKEDVVLYSAKPSAYFNNLTVTLKNAAVKSKSPNTLDSNSYTVILDSATPLNDTVELALDGSAVSGLQLASNGFGNVTLQDGRATVTPSVTALLIQGQPRPIGGYSWTIELVVDGNQPTYAVNLVAGSGYTITPIGDSTSPVAQGGSYSFTVTIDEGYVATADFAVKANGTPLTATDGVYTISGITAEQTVTVTGVKVDAPEYEIALPTAAGYSIVASSGSASPVIQGGSYSFTVAITDGYEKTVDFAVKANGTPLTETDGVYTISNIQEAQTITVEGVAAIPEYAVALPTGTGYTVAATSGSASPVRRGGNYSFTVTFARGYAAGADFAVKANGTPLTETDGVYTISNIQEAQTITVEGVEYVGYTNTPPALIEGVSPTASKTITLGGTYSLNLAQVFTDADDDPLTYKVKIDDADPIAASASYSCKPTAAGTNTLVFTANDGTDNSTDTYTVTLTVEEEQGTDPTTLWNGGGWNAVNDSFCRIQTVTASGVSVKSFEWSGTTCNVVLVPSTKKEQEFSLLINMPVSGSNQGVKINGSNKAVSASTYNHTVALSNGTATVTLQPYWSSRTGTLKTFNFSIEGGGQETVYYVTLNSGTGYTVTPVGNSASPVRNKGNFTFQVNFEEGYKKGSDFAVKVNGEAVALDVNNQYAMTNITTDKDVTVEGVVTSDTINMYNVTFPEAEGVTFAPVEGYESPVVEGNDFKFTMTHAAGYMGGTVSDNGTAITPDDSGVYTLADIAAHHAITVTGIVHLASVTAPTGSTVRAGYENGEWTYYFYEPADTADNGDGTTVYYFNPVTSGKPFYRVQNPQGATYWNFESMAAGKAYTVTMDDLTKNGSYSKDTVYHDFYYNYLDLGDVYLTANAQGYLPLAQGATKSLNAFRNWSAIESFTNSQIALPDFHYEVVDINGNPSDLVTVTTDANNTGIFTLHASSSETGMAIVKVTYDAMIHMDGYADGYGAGGADSTRLGAIWPECTGIIVVTVGQDGSSIPMGMAINTEPPLSHCGKLAGDYIDAEHDLLYYYGDEGATYTFKPENGATVSIARCTLGSRDLSYSGFTTDGVTTDDEGNVTLTGLTAGRHIVKVEKNGLANYQVVSARQITIVAKDADGNIMNDWETRVFAPGDSFTLTFHNVNSPQEKLAQCYNCSFSLMVVGENGEGMSSQKDGDHGYGQYNFSSMDQVVTITVPSDWTAKKTFKIDGAVSVAGYSGTAAGGHRTKNYGGASGGASGQANPGVLGRLPQLTLNVDAAPHVIDTLTNPVTKSAGVNEAYTLDLSQVFVDENSDSLTYTVKIDDAEAVAAAESYSVTFDEAGVYNLEFAANDGTVDSSDTYKLVLKVGQENTAPNRKADVAAKESVSLGEGGTYTIDLAPIFEDADSDYLSYKVAVDGAEPVAVTASHTCAPEEMGVHTFVFTANDGTVDSVDTYTVKLNVVETVPGVYWDNATDGNGWVGRSATYCYVQTVSTSGLYVQGFEWADATTCNVTLIPGSPENVTFDFTVTNYARTATTAGIKINGTSSTGSSRTVPINLVNGQATVTVQPWGTNTTNANYQGTLKTFNFTVANAIPELDEGIEATATAETVVCEPWTKDLSTLFIDADHDALTYKVKVDDADPVAADANYSFIPAKTGTYTLVFIANDGKDDSTDTYTVTLTALSAVPAELQLSKLEFRAGTSATSVLRTMEPAFDPEVKNYTVIAPTNLGYVGYAFATLADTASGTIKAAYPHATSGAAQTKTITSGGSGVSLTNSLASNSFNGNTITIKVNDQEAYIVNVVRQAPLNSLAVKNGDDAITLTPSFAQATYEYSANVPNDAQLAVTPTISNTNLGNAASFDVAGQTVANKGTATVEPTWTDRTYDLVVTVSGPADSGARDTVYTIHCKEQPVSLVVETPPTKATYDPGETFDPAGMTLKATFADGGEKIVAVDEYTYSPTAALKLADKAVTVSYGGLTVDQPITINAPFEGSGTQEDPFLIRTAADYDAVKALVASGDTLAGVYLKQVADITLNNDWSPIGTAPAKCFSGNLDADNHLVVVPEGGMPLLGFVNGATVSNMQIYGERIAGAGLVNNMQITGVNTPALTLDNITLKSGTSTLRSGLVDCVPPVNAFGAVSAGFMTTIRNCTVEAGVTVGYDGTLDYIGGFAGRFQGMIENSTCNATVKGNNYVGGFIGMRANSLGVPVGVHNSTFGGDVIATGENVGGIAGAGYVHATAPNAGSLDLVGNTVSGTVTGANRVGGILGANTIAQTWNNTLYEFKDNTVLGTVTATAENADAVGAIAGYYRSLNRYDAISNNVYTKYCGVDKPVGKVDYVDTNSTTHETESGALYFNTENDTSGCPTVSGCSWKKAHNRTDDPLGSDSENLWKAMPAVTAAVDYSAQWDGSYLMPLAKQTEVSSDLAETYGYNDKVLYSENVSALDVMVAAHVAAFGDDFTPATASGFFAMSGSTVNKLFGIATINNGYVVNDGFPNDGTSSVSPYDGQTYYNGLTIDTTPVVNGDVLDFFIYADDMALDTYTWLEVPEAVYTGEEFEVSGAGICYGWYGGMYATPADLKAAADPEEMEGAGLAWLDPATGRLTTVKRASFNDEGKVTIKAPAQRGTYYLVAVGDDDVPVIMNPVKLEVIPIPVTAKVDYSAQAAGDYLMPLAKQAEVSSDLAESYGYTDNVDIAESVSALDVMVAAHIAKYGEGFTPETATEYFEMTGNSVTKLFGESTINNGFTLNDGAPNDGGEPSEYGYYNGLTVDTTPVATGDVVDFFIYQDSMALDIYTWLEVPETVLTSESFEVSGAGICYGWYGTMYATPEELKAAADPEEMEDAGIAWLDPSTGGLTVITGSAFDDEGKVTIAAPAEPGTYYLVAVGENYGESPVVMNPSKVEVEPYTLAITNKTGMFKAVTATATQNADGSAVLTMALSGTGYHWLYKGTYEEAVAANEAIAAGIAAGEGSDKLIKGYLNDDGKWEFQVPISADELGTDVPVVAISNSKYNNYLNDPDQNPLERAYYPRQLNLDLDEATLVTGDFFASKDLAVTNSYKMFKVTSATLDTVGGPNSNGYAKNLVLTMSSDSYTKAFIGTAAKAATATSGVAELGEGNIFSLKVLWMETAGDPSSTVKLWTDGEPLVVSFWSKKNEQWYERQLTLDEVAATLVTDKTPDPVTATVDFSAQAAGDYLMPLAKRAEVASNLAESYGYEDQVPYAQRVSALDVMVAAHIAKYGEAFKLTTATEYFEMTGSSVTKLFGESTINNGFTLNDGAPNDGGEPSEYGYYNGLTVDATPVATGDVLDFFIYQDSMALDIYTWLTVPESVTAGESFEVSGAGICYGWYGTMYATPEALEAAADPEEMEDAGIAWLDPSTGGLTAISGSAFDEDGKVTIAAPAEPGTYYLVAVGENYSESPVVMNPAKVTVNPVPVTATVDFTSQLSGGFLHAPQFNVEVASNLAESYGYVDSVPYGENVSVLDVLVKAHELVYGEAFTKETANTYLIIGTYGSPNRQFGVDKSDFYGGFYLNHAMANDGTKYDDDNWNGTTVITQKVVNGDLVEFFFYEDPYYGDTYNWFVDADGTYSRTFNVTAGVDLNLTLKGFFAMSASIFEDAEEMTSSDVPTEQADVQVYTVNLETGALTEIDGAITDEDGEVTLNFSEPGTYTITAYGTEDCMFTQILTLTTVQVAPKPNTPPTLAEGVEATATADAIVGRAYTLDLSTIFTDADGDELTYKVKIGEVEPIDADANFSYKPAVAGTTTLVFTANDGTDDSVDTYTVTLTATDPIPVSEFAYDGDGVNFIKADGSGFGMYKPQEGTTIAIEGDNVVITYYPQNANVYTSFYLGGDNLITSTWNDEAHYAIADGAYSITLPKSYCGYAWPVAIVKADGVTTPSAQYYLAIPSEDKLVPPAPAQKQAIELAGSSRFDTASIIVNEAFDSSQYVIVASGENFPDALAASSLAGLLDCPVVLTAGASLSPQAAAAISELGATKAIIVGGTGAVSDAAKASVESITGSPATRLSGSDRYATMLAIYNHDDIDAPDWGDTAILATGTGYADTLSISGWAFANDAPIFLCDPNKGLTADTQAALSEGGFTRVVIVGGTGVVPKSAEGYANDLVGENNVTRLAGADRYATSKAIAEFAIANGGTAENACIATGQNFPDALAGSTLVGKNNSVLLLADPGKTVALDVLAANADSIYTIYYLGGSGAVTPAVRAAAEAAIGME